MVVFELFFILYYGLSYHFYIDCFIFYFSYNTPMKVLYLDHNLKIPYCDILYLEHFSQYNQTLHRITILYTKDQKYIMKCKIKDIFSTLDPNDFMMPHQSYVVNMYYIQVFTQSYLLLDDGTRIPISIKRSATVRTQFLNYINEKRT